MKIAAIVLLLGVVVLNSFSALQSTPVVLAPGEERSVQCSTELTISPVSPQEVLVHCADDVVPTATSTPAATATSTPTRTPTSVPNTPTATNTPAPTNTPGPTSTPLPPGSGMWISPERLASLPMSGTAWNQISGVANGNIGTANISDQDSDHDVNTLAVALVAMRTGNAALREKAAAAIMSAIETENGGRTLALARNLDAYVIAADVIRFSEYDSVRDNQFRAWLSGVRTEVLDGRTLISTFEDRPNNWGTHAGTSVIAADIYLGDISGLNHAADVFQGWLGDRSVYASFDYGDTSWQCDPGAPVGVNPTGCTKSGHDVDGVLPDDQRRTGSFSWPPPCGNYPHGAMQGATVSAELLSRAGYDAWNWSDQALRRAYVWLYSTGDGKSSCPAVGDDAGFPILVNRALGTTFPEPDAASPGKNMAWLGWTHK